MVYYLEIGDRVIANSTLPNQPNIVGTLRYIGPTSYKEGTWVGIELDEYSLDGKLQHGKNDGSVDGVRYFTCQPGKGIFVNANRVQRCYREPFSLKSALSQPVLSDDLKTLDVKSARLTVKKPLPESFDLSIQQKSKMEENPFWINPKKWESAKNEVLEVIKLLPEKVDLFDSKSKELVTLISGAERYNKIDEMGRTFLDLEAKKQPQNSNKKLEIVQTQAENDNYQEIIKRYRDEVDRLHALMDSNKQEIENLNKNYSRISVQLNETHLRHEDVEAASAQKINSLENELQRLVFQSVSNSENTELIRTQLLRKTDEIKSLGFQLEEARTQLLNERKKHDTELDLLQSENTGLKKKSTL